MKLPRAVRLAALLVVALAAIGILRAETAADKSTDKLADIYTVVYSLADLPAFRSTPDGPVFDSSVVEALIEASVAPDSWDPAGPASMAAFVANRSLVISQNQANHGDIVDLLRSLRKAQVAARR